MLNFLFCVHEISIHSITHPLCFSLSLSLSAAVSPFGLFANILMLALVQHSLIYFQPRISAWDLAVVYGFRVKARCVFVVIVVLLLLLVCFVFVFIFFLSFFFSHSVSFSSFSAFVLVFIQNILYKSLFRRNLMISQQFYYYYYYYYIMVVLHYTYSLCFCCYLYSVFCFQKILATSLLRTVFFLILLLWLMFSILLNISLSATFRRSLTCSSRAHWDFGWCCCCFLLLSWIIWTHTELVWLLKMKIESELEFSGIEMKWKIWNLNGIWIVNRCWNSKQNGIHGKHTNNQTMWKLFSAVKKRSKQKCREKMKWE